MKTQSFTIARPDTGAVLPFAVVTVFQADGITRAALFTATGGAQSNPVIADQNGAISITVPDGTYVLSPVSADGTLTVPQFPIDIYDLPAIQETATASALTAMQAATQAQGAVHTLTTAVSAGGALPFEVTALSGSFVGTGTGGTPGEYALVVSGGPAGHTAFITIGGPGSGNEGKIASARIGARGIATANTAPTYALPSGTGLTGATLPTATVTALAAGRVFFAPNANSGATFNLGWQSSGGVIAPWNVGGGQFAVYLKGGVDAVANQTSALSDKLVSLKHIAAKRGSVFPVQTDSAGGVTNGTDDKGFHVARYDPAVGSNFSRDLRTSLGADMKTLRAKRAVPVAPLLTDITGAILAGIDVATGQFIGTSSAQIPVQTPPVALASGDRITLTSTTSIAAITAGQSLSNGTVDVNAAVISGTQLFSNVGFSDGPRHVPSSGATRVPLIEVAVTGWSESPVSGMANFATELALRDNARDPSQTVFFGAAAGVGNTSITQWLPTSDPASTTPNYHTRLTSYITDAAALETAAGRSLVVPAIAWLQGENDASTMTTANYKTYLQTIRTAWQTAIQAITGQTVPVAMILYQTSSNSLKTSTGQGRVAQAQFELCRDVAHFYHGTMISHMPQNGGALHLTPLGYLWTGRYFGRKLKQLAIDGVKPQSLRPLSAIARTENGVHKLRVKFEVPWKPLVFDTTVLPAGLTNYGLAVSDGSGAVTMSDISIEDGDTVVATLNRLPSAGSAEFRNAMDYRVAGATGNNNGQTNLCDSCPDEFSYGGTTYGLPNICPHLAMPVTVL